MRTFGSYEAVEELSRTAFGAVYSARPSGSAAPKPGAAPAHFVKVFAPPALDDAGVRAGTQTENFLAAARLQQKAAAASRHWAPVHEIGTSAEGAYYVSSLYPMSARRLVMGRVKLTDGDLHALISAVVQGLKDLRASCAQAHGNIKPTTVLLPRGGESAYSQAVLAEPLLPHKAATVTEAADLADLAKLVYQLVVHRPFSEAGGWPIPPGAEWSRLGARGEAWRELCNKLLDPASAGDVSRGLDWLSDALAGLKPRRQLVPVKMRVAAVVVLLLAGIGYGLYVHYAPSLWYRDDDWRQLADAYRGWLRALDQTDGMIESAMTGDEELRDIVNDLKGSGIVFDTMKILGERAQKFAYEDAELRKVLPDTWEAQGQTKRAVDHMAIFRERMKKWRKMELARDVRGRCAVIAPGGAAEARLTRLLELASPEPAADESTLPPTAIEFAGAVLELARLTPMLERIDEDLKAIEGVGPALSAQRVGGEAPDFRQIRAGLAAAYVGAATVQDFAERLGEVRKATDSIGTDWGAVSPVLALAYDPEDEVLKLVPEFVRRALRSPDGEAASAGGELVAMLQRRVRALRVRLTDGPLSPLKECAGDWAAGRIDKEELRKSPLYTEPAGRSPEELLAAWAASAKDYVKLTTPDPRPGLADRAKELDEELAGLDADYRGATTPEIEVEHGRLKASAAGWKTDLSELRDQKWLSGRRELIEAGVTESEKVLDDLLKKVRHARTVPASEIELFIAGMAERRARFAHPSLARQWQAVESHWLRDAAKWKVPGTLRRPDFRKVEAALAQAEKRLLEIGSLPRELGVAPGPRPPAWHGELVAELEKSAEVELTTAVNAGLRFSDWSNLDGDSFAKHWPAVREAYREWVEDAAGLVRNLNLVEALLDGGYGLQPAANDAYASARKSRHWAVAEKRVGSLLGRIEALEKLTNDREGLLAAAKGDDASVAVAAWRRLGTPDWPSDVKELDEELLIQDGIGERLKGGGTGWAAAETVLRDYHAKLEEERRVRRRSAWRRLAEEVGYGENARRQRLDEVMARMTACAVALPADGALPLRAETRFNIALYRFRQDLQDYRRRGQPNAAAGERLSGEEQDRRAVTRLAAFKSEVPEELRTRKRVIDMLAEIEKQAKPMDRVQVAMAEDGPLGSRVRGVEWKMTSDARDEVRTYTWGAHTLRFRRLEQSAGAAGDAVFLCTSEVSLGLFKGVIDAAFAPAAAAAAADGKSLTRLKFAGLTYQPNLRGPHVWTDTLGPQFYWLPRVHEDFVKRLYAERLGAVDEPLRGPDRFRLPVQRVSPAAAMHFAHLLGCRLPTSGEFGVALTSAAISKEPPNLRDETWKIQQDYLVDIAAREGVVAEDWAPWPDAGTFDKGAGIPSGMKAEAVAGAKADKFLWFRPVHTADDTFGDLVGNVAEWLWDEAKALEEAPKEGNIGTFKEIVAKHWRRKLYIAGGSAISTFRDGADRHEVSFPEGSYADVGFRLAFTVPSRTIVDRMRIVADKQPYEVAATVAADEADGRQPAR